MIYVEDFIKGAWLAANKEDRLQSIYHLAETTDYSWNDIVTTIAQNVNKKAIRLPINQFFLRIASWGYDLASAIVNRPLKFGSQKYVEMVAPNWLADATKARIDLGFQTNTDLVTGIKKTTHWYQEMGWI